MGSGVKGKKDQLSSPIRLRTPWVVLGEGPRRSLKDRSGLQTEIEGLLLGTTSLILEGTRSCSSGLAMVGWRSLRNIQVDMSNRLLDIQF